VSRSFDSTVMRGPRAGWPHLERSYHFAASDVGGRDALEVIGERFDRNAS